MTSFGLVPFERVRDMLESCAHSHELILKKHRSGFASVIAFIAVSRRAVTGRTRSRSERFARWCGISGSMSSALDATFRPCSDTDLEKFLDDWAKLGEKIRSEEHTS